MTLIGLGDLPGGKLQSSASGVSADGTVVAGRGFNSEGQEAFRWTAAEGLVGLGNLGDGPFGSVAHAVSADGSTIVGVADGTTSGPFRWTADAGMEDLGALPMGRTGWASGVSADGSVVVGSTGADGLAFRWTDATGAVDIGSLSDQAAGARGVSADGSTIVGWSWNEDSHKEAFRWTGDEGMVGLGYLDGLAQTSDARAASPDGSVIVGESGLRAFRWTEDAGMIDLGAGAGSQANDMSADGSVVVGEMLADDLSAEAFIWTQATGSVDLLSYLAGEGVAGLDAWLLTHAAGISADGTTIVGHGLNPQGAFEAWVVTVPSPGGAAAFALAGVGAGCRRAPVSSGPAGWTRIGVEPVGALGRSPAGR